MPQIMKKGWSREIDTESESKNKKLMKERMSAHAV